MNAHVSTGPEPLPRKKQKKRNKRLTKAIRERMSVTGERYTTARMHILARLARDKEAPIDTAGAREGP